MSTITLEQHQKIADFLATHELPKGLGTKESACSIASINLALNGRLTDDIPACMSEVIGRWIIKVQDAMPFEIRNSSEWKYLLPFAAGTGRDKEQQRIRVILDWQWTVVLPSLQEIAEKYSFGEEWRTMCTEKTSTAACAAACAADAAADAAYAADAARTAIRAAYAAADAADAARAARTADAAWKQFNPCKVLADLIACGETK